MKLSIIQQNLVARINRYVKVNIGRQALVDFCGPKCPEALEADGMYNNIVNQIFWAPSPDKTYQTRVLFHELGHATSIPLKRSLGGNMFDDSYAIEEIIAETISLKLMTHFGLTDPDSEAMQFNYIYSWNKYVDINPSAIELKAEAAVSFILKNWLKDFSIATKEAV